MTLCQLFIALCFTASVMLKTQTNNLAIATAPGKTGATLTRCFQVAVILSSVSLLYFCICAPSML